jgi:hypothetical protein
MACASNLSSSSQLTELATLVDSGKLKSVAETVLPQLPSANGAGGGIRRKTATGCRTQLPWQSPLLLSFQYFVTFPTYLEESPFVRPFLALSRN